MNVVSFPILTIEIRYEHDVVLSRQRARQIAEALGFERQDQVRLATAISELARNAFRHANGGKVEFTLTAGTPQRLEVCVRDQGPGIRDLQSILDGELISNSVTGLGIISAKRLVDDFQIQSQPTGTRILLGKTLNPKLPRIEGSQVGRIAARLASVSAQDPFAEMQRQNQELLSTLSELEKGQHELYQMNRELEDTNRGVVALYAELDQRAEYLRRVSEGKTRFLSHMTHEFRSPLNSIISLSRMLADRLDGELSAEQAKQVGFIQQAAADLSRLADDLLDLAKIDAGKVTVRPEEFELKSVFASLRGTLRPLLSPGSPVSLILEEPEHIPSLFTDEAKLSQILRNLISNALKYTQRGEVRVTPRLDGADHLEISVSDTGIGIAPEDQERIFDEFEQVDGSHQKRIKGTGLGLPLAKSLAHLLGGTVRVRSQPGQGSTFSVWLPRHYGRPLNSEAPATPNLGQKALIVDDDEASRYVLKGLLNGIGLAVDEAETGSSGLQKARLGQPGVIFLDLGLPDIDGEVVLQELKRGSDTRPIPVIINTSRNVAPEAQAQLLTLAQGFHTKNQPDPIIARENVRAFLTSLGLVAN